MLKAIGWLIKVSIFTVLVLVIGNYFKVGRKTISEQVQTQISHAEQSNVVGEVKDWARHVTKDASAAAAKKIKAQRNSHVSDNSRIRIVPAMDKSQPPEVKTAAEEIPSSERQKLKALMRELNTAREAN